MFISSNIGRGVDVRQEKSVLFNKSTLLGGRIHRMEELRHARHEIHFRFRPTAIAGDIIALHCF